MEVSLELLSSQNALILQEAAKEIAACNALSARYGLVLSDEDVGVLVQCRAEALKKTGRIEFGGGILPKLIYAFCDSPFLDSRNYRDTLAELQEIFYFYKSESRDRFSDDELIAFMVKVFNGRARGSTEYLAGTALYLLCRYGEEEEESNPFYTEDEEELF